MSSDAGLELLTKLMRWVLCGQWCLLGFLAPRTTVLYLMGGLVVFGAAALMMEWWERRPQGAGAPFLGSRVLP